MEKTKLKKNSAVSENDRYKTCLPGSESVVKQFAYARYIDKQCSPKENTTCRISEDIRKNVTSQNIYNAFIMPAEYNAPQNIGYVSADYILLPADEKPEHSYDKIYGILLDVKALMFNHIPHDENAIDTLAAVIDTSYKQWTL